MLQLAGVAAIDREAMTLYAKAVAVSALAVVGTSPVDRVVAHRLVGMTSPRCPHRYFTCRDEALEWLRSKPASNPETSAPQNESWSRLTDSRGHISD
jgi:hypothetical protein